MISRVRFAYIALVIAAGTMILVHGLWTWTSTEPARYIAFAIIAVVASGSKIELLYSGSISMSFLFVLIGISEFSTGETLLIGFLGALLQSTVRTKERPNPTKVAFSLAALACSIQAAETVHHAARLQSTAFTATVLFSANTWLVAGAIALTERKNVWKVWRDTHLWLFPEYLVGAAAAWLVGKAGRVIGWEPTLLLLPIVYVVHRSHRLYVGRLEEAKRRAEQDRLHAADMAALHRRSIETLALAVEAKDKTTHDHLQRVEVYAIEVGRDLALSPTELEALRAAALLHDIGKLAVPEYIISKPGRLTPEEFETMKAHTVIGAEIVDRIQFPYAVAPIVRGHHERWNGTGYPDGLAGEQIPIGSRILAVVDCLDALSTDRQYRRAVPLSEAIDILRSESGKGYDPRVVEVLVRRYVEIEAMARTAPKMVRLPTNVIVERGVPAAGFEKTAHPETLRSGLTNLDRSVSRSGSRTWSAADLAGLIAKCPERQIVFAVLRSLLSSVVPYDAMVVYFRRGAYLVPECMDGEEFNSFMSLEITVGTGLSGWVGETGQAIVNGNPTVEPGYLNDPVKFGCLRSALAVPLVADRGIIGVTSLYLRGQDAFTIGHRDALISLCSALTNVLESKEQVMAS